MAKLNLSFLKNMNRNTILVCVAVIGIIITGGLIYANSNHGFTLSNIFGLSDQQIAKNVIDYINNNKLSSTPASLGAVSEQSGLVKITIKIGTQQIDSYATKDGKLLFPQALNIAPQKTTATTQGTGATNNAPQPTTVTKTSAPSLEAFVVARCPYGLQMQRAIADAVKNIPSLAQYIKVRYFGSVSSDGKFINSMHDNPQGSGNPEGKENLRQICIREQQPAKYWDYVACQMKTGDTAGCQTSTGIDSAKLNSCVSDPKQGVAYAQKDFTLSDKYGVQGSPTLVLNGTTISEDSYGGRSSDGVKSMVCAGFTTQPGFCTTKLNTASAATSFSSAYAASAAATGNSGATGANCAPAQ